MISWARGILLYFIVLISLIEVDATANLVTLVLIILFLNDLYLNFPRKNYLTITRQNMKRRDKLPIKTKVIEIENFGKKPRFLVTWFSEFDQNQVFKRERSTFFHFITTSSF